MISAYALSFDPMLPVAALIALAAIAFAAILYGAARRAAGGLWRLLALAGVLGLLANPHIREAEREPLNDIVALVVDESPSQALGDRAAQTAAARDALTAEIERLDGVEARLIEADRPTNGTRLFEALEQGLADLPRARLGAVILLTDGQVADAPETADALGANAPVHALITGDAREGDRKLTVIEAPRYGIVGENIAIKLRIDDFGATGAGGGDAEAVVKVDGEIAAQGRVPLGEERILRARLSHGGPNIIEVEVAAAPNELTLVNNAATLSINGVRDRLRVLLVSGEPHAGERAWRNLLKSDPAVDLVHFTILRPPNKQDGTPTNELALIGFPVRELFEEKLHEFDLIIFDRYRLRGVLAPQMFYNIENFVRDGGAVLVATGPAFVEPFFTLARTPLANLLPAYPTGALTQTPFRAAVTGAGFRHPVTAGLPRANASLDAPAQWGEWFRMIDARALSGDVLMSGPEEKPLLVLDRYGDGRVAVLLSDQSWLWSRGHDGGGPQAELFRRLAHWLMKEPDLEEEDLRAEARDGEILIRRRTMADEAPPAIITRPDGETIEAAFANVGPGRWEAAIPADLDGLYRIASGALYAIAAAGQARNLEFDDVIATPDRLRAITEASGGGLQFLDRDGRMAPPRLRRVRAGGVAHAASPGAGWFGVMRREQFEQRNIFERPLAPPWAWLVLIAGALVIGWLRESR